jgi:hypothetical protein
MSGTLVQKVCVTRNKASFDQSSMQRECSAHRWARGEDIEVPSRHIHCAHDYVSLLCLHTARTSSTRPSASTVSDTDTDQTIHVAFHFGDFCRQTYRNAQVSALEYLIRKVTK